MSVEALCPDGPVYQLAVDMNPAVSIPSVFLKTSCQSVVGVTGRRTGPYGAPLETIGNREKIFIVVLSIVLTTLVSLIASLAILMCHPKSSDDDSSLVYQPSELTINPRDTAFHMSRLKERKSEAASWAIPDTQEDDREPCIGECWSYSAFRFRSQCISGHCVCRGEFYDECTCLPKVYGCRIQRNKSDYAAYMKDRPQTVYSCDTLQPALQKRTVVLSTYGHHNSDKTVVDIMAASSWNNQSITLILANYFPTKWRMNLHEGVRIEKIILISNDHVVRSSVQVVSSGTPTDPLVQKKSYLVGYGDDRYGGHTVGLLKYITRKYGRNYSFHGSHYADRWSLVLRKSLYPQDNASSLVQGY